MEENRFKQLRYEDKYCTHRIYTLDEMSEITGLNKSTISKIENNGVDNLNASTLRAYHDKLKNVSYEYLMGDVPTREKKYYKLGRLFPFDDSFYQHLKELLALDDKDNHFVEFMLASLLRNPQELFNALITIFNTLYKINNIQHDNSLPDNEKTEMIKMQEYIFNQSTIDYLENTLMPLLQKGFEWKNEQLMNETTTTQEIINELTSEDDNSTPAIVTVTAVTPIKNKHE